MTPQQHMKNIVSWFKREGTAKYDKGQQEHGGKLWRKPALKLLGEEILDMPIYFRVLEQQQEEVIEELESALNRAQGSYHSSVYIRHIQNALNILKVGNKEGVVEEEK